LHIKQFGNEECYEEEKEGTGTAILYVSYEYAGI
jgi:hypothetical protein